MKYVLIVLLPVALAMALALAACDTAVTGTAGTVDDTATLSKQDKVPICHWDEYAEEFIPIEVAEPAVEAHFTNHGDFMSYEGTCDCPCFDYDDLLYEYGISSGFSCGSGNGSVGARVFFRYSGVAQDPYQALTSARGGPSCTSPGTGDISGFADELATMCIDMVLQFCD